MVPETFVTDNTPWTLNEPNDSSGSEDCVETLNSAGGSLNDNNCAASRRGLCEKSIFPSAPQ